VLSVRFIEAVQLKVKMAHGWELHGLYSSPNLFQVIKSGKMRWAGHGTRVGRGEVHARFCWDKHKERDRLEVLGVVGRM